MKDHGLDATAQNKLNYDIKSKTPATELFNKLKTDGQDAANTVEKEKMTIAKPFDFQTAKRMRVQSMIDQEICDEDGSGS